MRRWLRLAVLRAQRRLAALPDEKISAEMIKKKTMRKHRLFYS